MDKLHAFHQTRKGHLLFGITELLLAYVFASISIGTANIFAYLATVLLFVGAITNFINAAKPKNKKGKTKV